MPLPTGGSNISSNTTLPGPGGLTAVTPCYRCSYCQRGFTSQCGGPLGGYMCTVQMDGNMAEYFAVPAAQANLTPIPDALIDAQAVYTCRRSRCQVDIDNELPLLLGEFPHVAATHGPRVGDDHIQPSEPAHTLIHDFLHAVIVAMLS
jgi:Alcohol dehydrogenase GroES-like domain